MNEQGNVLLDKYVRQKERVTDYRTRYSGIHPQDVTGSKAEPFAVVQKEAADLFKGRVLVGHALQNDLKVAWTGFKVNDWWSASCILHKGCINAWWIDNPHGTRSCVHCESPMVILKSRL